MHFPELAQLEALVRNISPYGQARVLREVTAKGMTFPIYGFVFGPDDKKLPCFGLFGGVHGLENIGTHVCTHYLNSFIRQLSWDRELRGRLNKTRMVSIPLINPGGMYLQRRSNPQGIDLMRNGPQDSMEAPHFLVGGHRFGPWLPWYRGKSGEGLATENVAVTEFIRQELFPSKAALSLDVHSGFGLQDRLWFPYAKTKANFPNHSQCQTLKGLLESSFPHHVYRVESQADAYLIHGDLWDYLYDLHRAESSGQVYIPWALEMGSWSWVRKNPLQIFSLGGPFNPIKPHRYRRIMRRHMHLIDFLHRAALNFESWTPQSF